MKNYEGNWSELFDIGDSSNDTTTLHVDIASRGISLQIKIEEEGVIVDAFPIIDCTGSDSLATMAVETPTEEDDE